MIQAHNRERNTLRRNESRGRIVPFCPALTQADLYWLSARISMQSRAYNQPAMLRAAAPPAHSRQNENSYFPQRTLFSQAAKRTSGRPKVLHRPPSPHQPYVEHEVFFWYIFLRFPLRRIEQQWGCTDPIYRCCLNHRGGRSSHLRPNDL